MNKEVKRPKKRHVLLRFTLSYVLLLVIPFCMCVASFFIAESVIEERTVEANFSSLQASVKQIETEYANLTSFTVSISQLPALQRVMTKNIASDAGESYALRSAIEVLPTYQNSRFVTRYYIYSDLNGFVVEPGRALIAPLEKYYAGMLAYGEYTYPQFLSEILMRPGAAKFYPADTAYCEGAPARSILYAFDLYLLMMRRYGKIVYYIDEKALLDMIRLQEVSYFCIADKDGTTLASYSLDGQADQAPRLTASQKGVAKTHLWGKEMLVLSYTSNALGWNFFAAIPRSVFFTDAANVLKPMLLGMLVLLLIGVFLTAVQIRNNRKPILQMLELLPVKGGSAFSNGLWLLNSGVSQLLSDNREQNKLLAEQRLALRNAAALRLAMGEIDSEQQMEEELEAVGIRVGGESFRGIYLCWNEEEENQQQEYNYPLVQEALRPFEKQLLFLTVSYSHRFLLLYQREEGTNEEELTRILSALYDTLHRLCHLDPLFFVGYETSHLRHISRSFESAQRLMESTPHDANWLYVAQRDSAWQGFVYSSTDEQRLIGLTNAGNAREVAALLEKLHGKYAACKNITFLEYKLLYYRMVHTLLHFTPLLPVPDDLTHSLGMLSLDSFFSLLKAHYMALCAAAMENRKQHTSNLLGDVLRYIEEHYDQSSLCLASVAQNFGITEKYLSAFIKNNANIHFSTFLEGIRIRKAQDLLKKDECTIEEIAARCGYTNDKTFRRAFQRNTGVPPSIYREKYRV